MDCSGKFRLCELCTPVDCCPRDWWLPPFPSVCVWSLCCKLLVFLECLRPCRSLPKCLTPPAAPLWPSVLPPWVNVLLAVLGSRVADCPHWSLRKSWDFTSVHWVLGWLSVVLDCLHNVFDSSPSDTSSDASKIFIAISFTTSPPFSWYPWHSFCQNFGFKVFRI